MPVMPPASELVVLGEDVIFVLAEVPVAPRFHVAIHEGHVSFLVMPTGRLLLGSPERPSIVRVGRESHDFRQVTPAGNAGGVLGDAGVTHQPNLRGPIDFREPTTPPAIQSSRSEEGIPDDCAFHGAVALPPSAKNNLDVLLLHGGAPPNGVGDRVRRQILAF